MIRSSVVFTNILLLIGSLFCVGNLIITLRKPTRKKLLFWSFLSIVSFIFLSSEASAYLKRRELRELSPDIVESIQIANTSITQAGNINKLILALRDIEGYAPNHENPPHIPFIIKLKSGKVYNYQIRYRKTNKFVNGDYVQGIVILFAAPKALFNLGGNYGFSEALLRVISDLDIKLE